MNFIKNLKPGNHVVFDIGANEGFVSETFLENKITVIAVEPDERNISHFNGTICEKRQISSFPCAAGSKTGDKELYLQKNGTAFSTLNPKWKDLIEKGEYGFIFYMNRSRKKYN